MSKTRAKPTTMRSAPIPVREDGALRAKLLAMKNLPANVRWTAKKKKAIAQGIQSKTITMQEALDMVPFTSEAEWNEHIRRLAYFEGEEESLMATKVHEYDIRDFT